MKAIQYDQMIIGLDNLFFSETDYPDSERAELIEAYLEATGWDWNAILQHMLNEDYS